MAPFPPISALDLLRSRFGPAPRRLGWFGWKEKLAPGVPIPRQKALWRHGTFHWGYLRSIPRALLDPGTEDLDAPVLVSPAWSDEACRERFPAIATAPDPALPPEVLRLPLRLHRPHLPGGALGGHWVPLLVHAGAAPEVLLVPGSFWPEELSGPWTTAIAEHKMRRSLSLGRIEATRAWDEDRAAPHEPPVPWAEATPDQLAGTWAREEERISSTANDGAVLSEWITSSWQLDIEQRCWHRTEVHLLADGLEATPDTEPVRHELSGAYELRDGVLTCSLDGQPEAVVLVATADGALVAPGSRVYLRTCSLPRVEGVTEGGSTLYRHTPRAPGFIPPNPEGSNLVPIEEHLEAHLGPVDFVWHELVSDLVHIDIHVIRPSPDRPWYTLVTSGMSDLPMHPPEGAADQTHAEVMICLPATWDLRQESFDDERVYWPIRWLKILARLPHEYTTWLSYWHTIPNGDPPEPLAEGSPFVGFMLVPPMTTSVEFHELLVPPLRTIRFLAALPLTADEMEFKLHAGAEELMTRLERAKVTELVDPRRRSVLR